MTNSVSRLSDDQWTKIRPFPVMAMRILHACHDSNVTVNELCDLIKCDPATILKIMQVANSSAYGFAGEIVSLKHAVVVLGFRSLRNLALSVALNDVFSSDEEFADCYSALWEKSIWCATIAGQLAKSTNLVAPDEAFLAGMVHDVGKLMFLDVAAEDYQRVTSGACVRTITRLEIEAFQVDHQELGLRCADEWGLPYEISEAIGAHHAIFEETGHPDLVKLVGLSEALTDVWSSRDADVSETDLEAIVASSSLTIDVGALTSMAEKVHEDVKSLDSAFGI